MAQTDYRDQTQNAISVASAAQSAAAAVQTSVAPSQIAWTADVIITYTGLIALNLSPLTKSFDVAGAQVDDRIYVHRHGKPTMGGVNVASGIQIEGTGFVPTAGKVEVYHTIPAVGLSQTLSIPLRLVAYRAVSST